MSTDEQILDLGSDAFAADAAKLTKIDKAYSSPPWWYDIRGFFILCFSYRSTLTLQVRFFNRHMSAKHLEVAVGTGTLLKIILAWRKLRGMPHLNITGIDYAESMLQGARENFAGNDDITLCRRDAADLRFPDNHFESASCANAMHCIPDIDGAIRETFRVLKPGSTFAVNVLLYPRGPAIFRRIAQRINDWGIRKGILYTPYEQADIRRRFETAGFLVEQDFVSGNACMIVARKPAI